MEQAQSFKRVALVVEEDARQRASIATLLEESEVQVIQCESGEAAELSSITSADVSLR
jgi:DNA-binding response OmpR family regulator